VKLIGREVTVKLISN